MNLIKKVKEKIFRKKKETSEGLPYKEAYKEAYKEVLKEAFSSPGRRRKKIKMKKGTFDFDPFLLQEIEKFSAIMGMSKGEFVRRAVDTYIQRIVLLQEVETKFNQGAKSGREK